MDEKRLQQTDPDEWRRRYFTAVNGSCAECVRGWPIVRYYISGYGYPCHVHAWPDPPPADSEPGLDNPEQTGVIS